MAMTMAIISMATTAAAGGMQAQAQYDAGKAKKAIYDRNAQQRRFDAKGRQDETLVQAREKRRDNNKQLARKKMLLVGGAGIQMEGTPLDILAEDAGNLEKQAINIERGGEKDYLDMMTEADMDEFKGRSAFKAGARGSTATAFQTVAKVSSQYSSYSAQGVI